jgi:hypothetical protein
MHCLNELGLVTKKQDLTSNTIKLSIADLTAECFVGNRGFVFLLRALIREFAFAGSELVIHAALNSVTSMPPDSAEFSFDLAFQPLNPGPEAFFGAG